MPPDPALQRLDGFPYVHRVADVMVSPVLTASPQASLQETVARLQAQRSGSCLVVDAEGKAIGILTERDLLNAVGRFGPQALERPLGALMSAPVQWIAPDALLYRAIARMDRLRLRHLAVLDAHGRPLGMLTTRALLRVRAGGALAIGDAVETAPDAATLRAAHDQLPALAKGLLAEGIAAADISAVVSAITRDITARAAGLAESEMKAAGESAAPAPWCLLVLGSAGRGESLLAPDQDNALIVADGGAAHIEGWFARWSERLNALLDQAGIPFCKGGVMARNRAFRRSESEWRAEIERWIRRPEGEALLNVDIFFDAMAVAGDAAIAERLAAFARVAASQALPFLRLLAEAGTAHRPPLGLFGRLKLEDGRLDLKRGGLLPIVAAARVMALKMAAADTGTDQRLAAAAAGGRIGADNAAGLALARRIIARTILGQQLADIDAGRPPGNRIDPRRLTRAERRDLKQALEAAGEASELVQDVLTS
ncbi:MAG: DUF294 nucleotidyltransferase-like domain-containing protein [Reyranellaceae bacterium]